jgi:SAM-dependent methyltransferase
MRRVRILDLGCGSADGYELLTGVRRREPDLEDVEVNLLSPDVLGLYKGIDLNADLIAQARAIYGDNPKLAFEQGDFGEGLPLDEKERPFDLYFTSYGTCSHHNDDETFIRMMVDVAGHAEDYCIVVCDWLGRYSYEWQTLWTNDLAENRNMDYVVSYIYEPEERAERADELQHLYLRLVCRREAEGLVAEASKRAGVEIKPLDYFDRGTFTGRHMDTADYNPHAQPIRQAVNSLHEANLRTDLHSLLIDYMPKPGFEFINDYFEHLQMCWNTLVLYVDDLLHLYDETQRRFVPDPPPIPAGYPPALQDMMRRLRLVIEGVGWLETGLPRENIIEPQLGYALRHLVMNCQQGLGCAHGLVGIFEIDKRSK